MPLALKTPLKSLNLTFSFFAIHYFNLDLCFRFTHNYSKITHTTLLAVSCGYSHKLLLVAFWHLAQGKRLLTTHFVANF